ncbi:hypothetical protein [Dickeya zeae]|uniref:hypothetical protein n=1 Tax=Dickeya zeae TaxID=204042 RepID=UPI0003A91565|nr:hypothetical protein [Dickeya zeae]
MNIKEIEREIDSAFEDSILTSIPYSQAVWELLSYLEYKHYQLTNMNGSSHDKSAGVDNMINFITHPLRVCFKKCKRKKYAITSYYSKPNANAAHEWYEKSSSYNNFCSIFPLFHSGVLSIEAIRDELKTNKDLSQGIPYEAYNRFFHKTGSHEQSNVDTLSILQSIKEYSFYFNGKLAISWNSSLSKTVTSIFEQSQSVRYHLPEHWQFSHFALGEFRKIAITISALSYARYAITTINAEQFPENGYSQRVWVIPKNELIRILTESSGYEESKIVSILEYLTFGAKGIIHPDVATQPLFDCEDGNYAISPFLFINSDIERNICVLLNQIEDDKIIYSSLVDEKERILYKDIKNKLSLQGYRCESGKVSGTDLDLAIIDEKNKTVLTVELKWFIEPAEVREINKRSQEIKKGIKQAKIIQSLLNSHDENLYKNILKIDSNYSHYSIVGSFNWIGYDLIQDKKIPVIKIGHLLSIIESEKNLEGVISILKNRQYLPIPNIDYKVVTFSIKSGNWTCEWYGLKSLTE